MLNASPNSASMVRDRRRARLDVSPRASCRGRRGGLAVRLPVRGHHVSSSAPLGTRTVGEGCCLAQRASTHLGRGGSSRPSVRDPETRRKDRPPPTSRVSSWPRGECPDRDLAPHSVRTTQMMPSSMFEDLAVFPTRIARPMASATSAPWK